MITAKLVTYRGLYRTIEVDSINLPSVEGRRGILPNHMPIMIPVEIGIMETVADGQKKRYAISDGMFYFENNRATLLADTIEDTSEIDRQRARLAQKKAQKKLETSSEEFEIERARVALQKAINRINAAEGD